MGWATDKGSGDTGISRVTVNGAAATGGTSTDINAAFWSQNVSLVTGVNTITVEARDGANNLSASQITINRAGGPAPVVTLTSSVASPQIAGTSINFNAMATGGTAPYQFKWWVQSGGVWSVAREWSTSASLAWQPTAAGTYVVQVWARNADATADASQALALVTYTINAGSSTPLSITSLTSSVASPQAVDATILFTTAAAGGTGPYQFKWWVFDGTAWWIVREWSTSATLNWRPTRAGNYIVAVWGRNAGVTADASQAMTQVPFGLY
jgi:hypothetical protein